MNLAQTLALGCWIIVWPGLGRQRGDWLACGPAPQGLGVPSGPRPGCQLAGSAAGLSFPLALETKAALFIELPVAMAAAF